MDIAIPAAVTVFPGEIDRTPHSWAERSYHKRMYFHEVDKGGHFAAWEQPDLFVTEIRAAFRPRRKWDRGDGVHRHAPSSQATRGNIDVTITVA